MMAIENGQRKSKIHITRVMEEENQRNEMEKTKKEKFPENVL